jgi:cell division protein FtsB
LSAASVVSRRTFQTVFITLVVVISLFAAAAYVGYSTAQSNRNLNDQISNYLSEIAILEANNTALQNKIAQLQTTINTLNAQISSLQATITQLQSQIATLQQQLAQLRAPKMIGNFTFTSSCPALGNCTYTADGSYANVGVYTAHSVSIIFSWYSLANNQGTLQCRTTFFAGDVSGRTIDNLPTQTCSSANGDALSMGYVFVIG